jgi:hypothetical protein
MRMDGQPQAKPTSRAVVFIHGIGDQTPGSSVRSFVNGLLGGNLTWAADKPAPYVSSQDHLDSTYELRRLHVWSDKESGRPGTDFFELYWADLMPPLTPSEGINWLKGLGKRPYKDMPPQMRPVWLLTRVVGLLVVIAGLTLAAIFGVAKARTGLSKVLAFGPLAFVIGIVRGGVNSFLRSSLGDAARYLSPHPSNVAARSKIRARGLDLLERLHADPRYERVIIVGHSLGSVIAYDIVNLYWSGHRFFPPGLPDSTDTQPALATYETLSVASLDPAAHLAAQGELWEENIRLGSRWLISDMITLGSPLAHGQLLMADSAVDFERRKMQRELPCCPPLPDILRPGQSDEARVQAFSPGFAPSRRVLHVGGVFASTRWNNLYFPVTWGFLGDPVGGPVAPQFGLGVVDHPVTSNLGFVRTRTPRAHSNYWSPSTPPTPLRDANEALRALLGFT